MDENVTIEMGNCAEKLINKIWQKPCDQGCPDFLLYAYLAVDLCGAVPLHHPYLFILYSQSGTNFRILVRTHGLQATKYYSYVHDMEKRSEDP